MSGHTLALPESALEGLSDKSKSCILNLEKYCVEADHPDLSHYPQTKLAGVLVLLYEQDGELRVLLTTRSKQLRTHAGQTALPGGKKDVGDVDLIATAYREAHEEVSLPLPPHAAIHTLGTLAPVISLHRLLVTPVVALLTQPSLLTSLKAHEGEVSHIFSHPLEALLDPELVRKEKLVEWGSEDWPYAQSELHNTSDNVIEMLGGTTYRMHRFRSSASPVKGLTSDILIKTADIAYGRPPNYERYAPGQLMLIKDVVHALQNHESSTVRSQ